MVVGWEWECGRRGLGGVGDGGGVVRVGWGSGDCWLECVIFAVCWWVVWWCGMDLIINI